MDKPKYFDEFSQYLPQNIEERIEEINQELQELNNLKRSNRLSLEDVEDVSDNYLYHIEWNQAISELNDELKCLQYQQYLDAGNESALNSFELQSNEG